MSATARAAEVAAAPSRSLLNLLLAAALVTAADPASAYFEETGVGARGLALGFGYDAMVSDPSAQYWNPAALTRLSAPEGTVDYAKPYGLTDLNAGALSLAAPVRGFGVALAWHHLGLGEVYAEDVYTAAAARALYHGGKHVVSAGAAFKFGRVAFQPFLDPTTVSSVDYGAISRGSFDAGLLWQTPWKIDLAWVGRDLIEPKYEFVFGSGGQKLAARQELAAALRWNRESTITLGWGQQGNGQTSLTAGIEVTFFEVFAIRSSIANLSRIYDSYGSPNDLEFNGGIGVFHNGYHVDATATTDHDLGASYRVSLRAPFGGAGR